MRTGIIIAALVLVGCDGTKAPVEPDLSWAKLKDGSQVAVGPTDENTNEAKQLVRCWKSGAGFDCVSIEGDEWRTVRRSKSSALPAMIVPAGHPEGYDCDVGGTGNGYQEHIFGKHGKLTEHVAASLVGPVEASWSKDYVGRYFEANDIKPKTVWFNCHNVAKVIQAGSNAALASTSMPLALIDGEATADE